FLHRRLCRSCWMSSMRMCVLGAGPRSGAPPYCLRQTARFLSRKWSAPSAVNETGAYVERIGSLSDARSRLLRAALGFADLEPLEPELRLRHRWLDTWSGV